MHAESSLGRIQDLEVGGGGAKSITEGARIEAPQALKVCGVGLVECPRNVFCFMFGSQNTHFGAFTAHLSVFAILYWNIRPGPDLQYRTPAQSDIPGWLWLDQLNQMRWRTYRRRHWTLSSVVVNTRLIWSLPSWKHDDSNSHSFSSDGCEFGGHGPSGFASRGRASSSSCPISAGYFFTFPLYSCPFSCRCHCLLTPTEIATGTVSL